MFTVPVTAEGSVPHEIMGEYGAYQACNLDGGSSAVMYYRGRIITHSSAANSERGRHIPDGWIVTEPKI